MQLNKTIFICHAEPVEVLEMDCLPSTSSG